MAYEDDRDEKEEGGGSFLMGLLAGTVLGAGLGMLFAPKSGNELRNQLSESAGRLRSTAEGTYSQASEKVSQMMDRGREAYERTRGSAKGTPDNTGATGSSSDTQSLSGAGSGTGGFSSGRG